MTKQLVPMDDYGVFVDKHDTARANSIIVAQMFEKAHDKVVRDIENLDCSPEFNIANFGVISYKDIRGRKQKAYAMTRDGFVFLVMGYRGKKAAEFKEAYIKRFNQMEDFIDALVESRVEFPLLTQQIKLMHENPQPYHFSNECDMLNRIALGMSAKQFREQNDIQKGTSIRPYLRREQIAMIDMLQKIDFGLLVAVPDYEQRKQRLEWYKYKMDTGAVKVIA